MGGQRGAVARQRQAERLGQAVHRVRREHARTRTAGGAGLLLHAPQLGVRDLLIDGVDHRIDQVETLRLGAVVHRDRTPGFHRATRDEDRRDVQPQRGQQHAGSDLVAVADADQRVGLVPVDHVLDRVGDDLTAGQRVEHAVVAHRDAVVDGDRAELARDAAGLLDRIGHDGADVAQSDVAGHELGEAVRDGDNRLAEVFVGESGGAPQGAGTGHIAAICGRAGSQLRHDSTFLRSYQG